MKQRRCEAISIKRSTVLDMRCSLSGRLSTVSLGASEPSVVTLYQNSLAQGSGKEMYNRQNQHLHRQSCSCVEPSANEQVICHTRDPNTALAESLSLVAMFGSCKRQKTQNLSAMM